MACATRLGSDRKCAHINHDDTQRYRGANPLRAGAPARQPHDRGHGTEVLDDGHIIARSHTDALGPMPSTAELTSAGRQVEVTALLEGVRRYVHGEVFVLADRTMHFPA